MIKSENFVFWLSININFVFFKYYNFFASSFSQMLNGVGLQTSPLLLNVVLPVGISFYTFHGLSYVIDIYLKRIKAEYNFVDYSFGGTKDNMQNNMEHLNHFIKPIKLI